MTTDASKIIRLNLNEAELSSFSELLLTNAVLASGLVDPREGQYQMFFVSAAGDQLHVIKTTGKSIGIYEAVLTNWYRLLGLSLRRMPL